MEAVIVGTVAQGNAGKERFRVKEIIIDNAESARKNGATVRIYRCPAIQSQFRDSSFASKDFRSCSLDSSFLALVAAVTSNFQEGVSPPPPSYIHGCGYIRQNQATTNQDSDPDDELLVGYTNDNTELRGTLEFDLSDI